MKKNVTYLEKGYLPCVCTGHYLCFSCISVDKGTAASPVFCLLTHLLYWKRFQGRVASPRRPSSLSWRMVCLLHYGGKDDFQRGAACRLPLPEAYPQTPLFLLAPFPLPSVSVFPSKVIASFEFLIPCTLSSLFCVFSVFLSNGSIYQCINNL